MTKKKDPRDQPTVSLPARITSIQPQKKNNNRYSIFVDDVFLLGISVKCLAVFGLKLGDVVTSELYNRLYSENRREHVEDYFLRLLARRPYARFELQTKARDKGYGEDAIAPVLDRFEEKGWIDDRDFAVRYASEHMRLKQWGPLKITSALISKGVSASIARQAVETVRNECNTADILKRLVQKRKPYFHREGNLLKRKKKILDFLVRKGFSSEIIYEHLGELMNEIE